MDTDSVYLINYTYNYPIVSTEYDVAFHLSDILAHETILAQRGEESRHKIMPLFAPSSHPSAAAEIEMNEGGWKTPRE